MNHIHRREAIPYFTYAVFPLRLHLARYKKNWHYYIEVAFSPCTWSRVLVINFSFHHCKLVRFVNLSRELHSPYNEIQHHTNISSLPSYGPFMVLFMGVARTPLFHLLRGFTATFTNVIDVRRCVLSRSQLETKRTGAKREISGFC